jgi:hypothetical protein
MGKRKRHDKKKGPKGGVKHQPGRGHDPKSGPQRKKRFARKAAKKRQEEEEAARRQWEQWERLTEEQRKLRPDLRPNQPRPNHDH